MFIRANKKKNRHSRKIYYRYFLVESVRTPNGPRQKELINLGDLKLDKQKWKPLANRIEEIITGQLRLLPVDEEIETLAQHYAKLYANQQIAEAVEQNDRIHASPGTRGTAPFTCR